MIDYLPWSSTVHEMCINHYKKGKFSVLDVELGGQCNYHCIYCDSPERNKKCTVNIGKIESLFSTGEIHWVFICGLGEPTVGKNQQYLLKILDLCERYNIRCSIFTNLSLLNEKLLDYIQKGVLHLLFKYDSQNKDDCFSIYNHSAITRQLLNVERIKKYVSVTDGHTNIAASIVPTQMNKNSIPAVVDDCVNNGIYPLIAELEHSGDAVPYFDQLALSPDELMKVKEEIEKITGEPYILPVCPAVIGGIHVRHDGIVTVDEYTGLSCQWFWLQEPNTVKLGDFNRDEINVISQNILSYRESRYDVLQELIQEQKEHVFGGCGGDIVNLIKEYLNISEEGRDNNARIATG